VNDRLIHRMPDALANKIAAGEVVQRPASALKELVENSLDAAAERIEVHLAGAGSTLVQVVDDGAGMSRADAVEAFTRHATSKLHEAADLECLRTLGFRGEALASIAAVAQVELRTRRHHDEAGTRVRADGGHVLPPEPCAAPAGTSVAVRNLFFNVHARRAFLRSPATEYRHLLEAFQALALSHPDVAFTLAHDGGEVYRLPVADDPDPAARLAHRIGGLFERGLEDDLVRVEEATSYLTVRGFVARPERYRRVRGEQFLFVNRRVVKSRALDHAVMSAFEGLLPEGTYPFYALFLDLDPAHVDCNVHPSKAEVKFDDERGVYAFMRAVVRRALAQADLVPLLTPETALVEATLAPHPALEAPAAWPVWEAPPEESGEVPAPPELFEARILATDAPGARPGEAAHAPAVLFQLHEAYVVTPIASGLMVLDQQAAHERVLYERALEELEGGMGLSQQLLFPHTVELSAPDLALVRELRGDLSALGFDVEFFSGRSLVVRGVPADIRAGDERTVLDDVLAAFRGLREGSARLPRHEALARAIARRSAIRPGQRLSPPEMRKLIDQLFACEVPFAAPDGRPTFIRLSVDELARRFERRSEGKGPRFEGPED
jgi:DNA mismatch repair protein MutL